MIDKTWFSSKHLVIHTNLVNSLLGMTLVPELDNDFQVIGYGLSIGFVFIEFTIFL